MSNSLTRSAMAGICIAVVTALTPTGAVGQLLRRENATTAMTSRSVRTVIGTTAVRADRGTASEAAAIRAATGAIVRLRTRRRASRPSTSARLYAWCSWRTGPVWQRLPRPGRSSSTPQRACSTYAPAQAISSWVRFHSPNLRPFILPGL
jgi:hypothetical protein